MLTDTISESALTKFTRIALRLDHPDTTQMDDAPASQEGPFEEGRRQAGVAPGEILEALNLPAHPIAVRVLEGEQVVYDPIRRKFVRLTPEEWVRQHFLQYLIRDCAYSAALMAVEMGFRYQEMQRRADIVAHDRKGRPFLVVECKAPGVPIAQSTFDQVSGYNRVVGARYCAVTNGLAHYCWRVDRETGRYEFLSGIPAYEAP